MSEAVHPVPSGFDARIGRRDLSELHDLANADPDRFWLDQARRLTWNTFPTQAGDWSFDENDFHIRWYGDGELNLSVNCLDRHLADMGTGPRSSSKPTSRARATASPFGSCTKRPAASRTCSRSAGSSAATG